MKVREGSILKEISQCEGNFQGYSTNVLSPEYKNIMPIRNNTTKKTVICDEDA